MKALILNLILPWSVLFLLQQSHPVDAFDAAKIGAQIEKYDADKFMLQERKKRVFKSLPLAKLNANKTDLLLQQIENDKLIKESFDDALSRLDGIDLSSFPEFEGLRETIEYFQNETSKAMADIIEIFEDLEKEQPTLGNGIIDASNTKEQAHYQDEQDEKDDFFDEGTYESQQEKLRGFRARARNNAKYHGYDHLFDIHDALGNGDHIFLDKMLSAFHRDVVDDTERSMYNNQGRRKLSKTEQCKQLRKCAASMNLYDLFMFFYSDFVDKNTGEFNVDANIVRFDESMLSKKKEDIEEALKKTKKVDDDDSCDTLLEHFHKTIDNKGTPEWHGGTVDEVCLAAKTTDYVSLTGIMSGIRNLNTFFEKSTQEYLIKTIDEMVLETMKCSAEMFFFNRTKNTDKENFIFMETLKTSEELKDVNEVQIPVGIDASSSGCEFVKLTDNIPKKKFQPKHTEEGKTWPYKISVESCKHLCCGKPWCHTFTCILPSKGETTDGLKDKQMCRKCQLYEKNMVRVGKFSGFYNTIYSTYSGSFYLDTPWYSRGKSTHDTYVMGKCNYDFIKEYTRYNDRPDKFVPGLDVGSTYSERIYNTNEEECLKKLEDNEDYLSYDWFKEDGGICYLSKYVFKLDELSRNNDYSFKTCQIEPSPHVRQATGQLVGENIGAGYLLKSYGDLKNLFKACVEEMIDDDTKTNEKAVMCIEKFTKPIDDGLKLIFGSSPSPGFICGISKAITVDNKKMPGKCCLDAPYQLKGDYWGHKPTCQTDHVCKHSAPFFAHLSEEACSAYGGTYCATPDCSQLRTCIENFKVGKNLFGDILEKTPTKAFLKYLNSAPHNITTTTEKKENVCYETREYFGFQGDFIQDKRICRSIERLQHSRDFLNLSTMMNMKQNDGEEGNPTGSSLILTSPSEEKSKSEVFVGELKWATKNQNLQHAIDGVSVFLDVLDAFECPHDMLGIAQTTCGFFKNIMFGALRFIVYGCQTALSISEFQRGVDAELGTIEFAQIWETTQAIWGNMEKTGQYLENMRESKEASEGSTVVEGGAAKQGRDLVQESMENMEILVKEEIDVVKKSMKKMENKMEKIERTLDMMTRILENGAANKI